MGYEVKLYIGEIFTAETACTADDSSGPKNCHCPAHCGQMLHEISVFDLCKIGKLAAKINALEGVPSCLYREPGKDIEGEEYIEDEGYIKKDWYGDRLKAYSLDDMIKALEEMMAEDELYRRFIICLDLLKNIRQHFPDYDYSRVCVIPFGH